jgi:hypothetical protein
MIAKLVSPHIGDAMVYYVSGHKAGAAGSYNRAAYASEKRTMHQRWADHVDHAADTPRGFS